MLKNKKMLLTLTGFVAAPAMIATLISCGDPQKAFPTQTKVTPDLATAYRISITDPENPRWLKANKELLAQFEAAPGAFSSVVKAVGDQQAFLDSALQNSPKGLIIGALDSSSLINQIKKAKQKSIPVVAYDRLITGTKDYDWYTTYDNFRVGELQGLSLAQGLLGSPTAFTNAKEMLDYLKAHPLTENKSFYMLGGGSSDNNAKIFYQGADSILKQLVTETSSASFKITRVGPKDEAGTLLSGWNYEEARNRVGTFLATTEAANLKGIVAPNDSMANAAIQALEQAKKDPKKFYITGQDFNAEAIANIKADKQKMTIYKPDDKLSVVATTILKTLSTKPTSTETEIVNAVKGALKTKFTLTDDQVNKLIKLDTTSYKSISGDNSSARKTIILEPTIVTKANVATIEAESSK